MKKNKTSKKRMTLSAKNKAFWKLSSAQKRIAVAKDVIKQINNDFYSAKTGTYFRPENFDINIKSDEVVKLDAALDEIKKQGGECVVCGIGGCFVSLVRLGDKIETEELFGSCLESMDEPSDGFMKNKLREVFTSDQLSLIECAFEKYSGHGDAPYYQREKAVDWSDGKSFEYNHNKRLIAIMKNIIKNNGTFKP